MIQAKKIKRALTVHKPIIQRQFGVKTIGIFGSYIRGEERRGSDLDVLVEFKKPVGLFEFMDLEKYLGRSKHEIDTPCLTLDIDIFEDNLRESASSVNKPVLDLGFRVFKLDSSNIRAWEPDRDNLAQSLFDATEHLKDDRTEQDILFELLLKLGLDLTVPIEQKSIASKTVHSIGAGVLAFPSTAMATGVRS